MYFKVYRFFGLITHITTQTHSFTVASLKLHFMPALSALAPFNSGIRPWRLSKSVKFLSLPLIVPSSASAGSGAPWKSTSMSEYGRRATTWWSVSSTSEWVVPSWSFSVTPVSYTHLTLPTKA